VFFCDFVKNKLDKPILPKNQSIYYILSYYILMRNNNGIITKIKHFRGVFKDKRTYDTFKAIASWILYLKNWKQWDLANVWSKKLNQIQYFFYKAEWNSALINAFRINWIRNVISWCSDKKSDICILDWTIITKNNKSNFSGFANWFFSNRDKKVVNGLEVFWASIYTKTRIKYMLDLSIFFKKNTLNSKDKRKWSLVNEARRKFIAKVLSNTKSWLVVLDSGFKWPNTCKRIFQVFKRHFLVRISESQIFFDEKGKKFKIGNLLTEANATYFDNWKIWVFRNVYFKSWIEKWVKIPVTIIVYHKNWARNPMVLATSASLKDVYNNMIREKWDPSWEDKVNNNLAILWEENRIYMCFVGLYRKRWSIEECFKELKSYLCFENFKVLSHESIMKYFHVVLVVHTLLTIMTYSLYCDKKSFDFVLWYLKEKRNIKGITIVWVKLFIEMMFHAQFIWNIKWKHRKTLAEILKIRIYLKPIPALN
jgi:hypothetical protein